MEENKNELTGQAVPVAVSDNPPSAPENPRFSNKVKILLIVCIFLGILALVAPFVLAKTVNSIYTKLLEDQVTNCNYCPDSNDADCTKMCKEEAAVITQVKLTPTVVASPSSTLSPKPTVVPSIVKKVTSVPKSTPTPAGNPTLIIKISKGVTNVTLLNQTTGKSTTESIAAPSKNLYIEPGAYRITFNEVPNCKAAYTTCYSRCMEGGDWGWDEYGNTPNVNVEAGKTNAISLFYADPNSPTKNPFTGCKDTQ